MPFIWCNLYLCASSWSPLKWQLCHSLYTYVKVFGLYLTAFEEACNSTGLECLNGGQCIAVGSHNVNTSCVCSSPFEGEACQTGETLVVHVFSIIRGVSLAVSQNLHKCLRNTTCNSATMMVWLCGHGKSCHLTGSLRVEATSHKTTQSVTYTFGK